MAISLLGVQKHARNERPRQRGIHVESYDPVRNLKFACSNASPLVADSVRRPCGQAIGRLYNLSFKCNLARLAMSQ